MGETIGLNEAMTGVLFVPTLFQFGYKLNIPIPDIGNPEARSPFAQWLPVDLD